MSRYHFNIHDGASFIDSDGVELEDLRAARNYAVRLSGDLLRDRPEQFWSGDDWSIEVSDERGLILFTLMFVATDAPCVAY